MAGLELRIQPVEKKFDFCIFLSITFLYGRVRANVSLSSLSRLNLKTVLISGVTLV